MENNLLSETNNQRRKNYTIWHEYTQDSACLRSKVNANVFISKCIIK